MIPRSSLTGQSRTRGAWLLPTAVLLLVLGVLTGSAGAQEGDGNPDADRPPRWSSNAGAAGVAVVFNTEPPLLPLEEFININVPYGESSWDSSGTARALAGSIYPGSSGTQGAALMCEFAGGCPEGFPPSYPFAVRASYPTQPDASTEPGGATAHAARDFVETRAGVSELFSPALGPLAEAVDVDSVTAVTRQSFSEDASTVVARGETVLQGIALAGGVVQIDELRVISVSRSAGKGKTAHTDEVRLSGVTAQGQPAKITDEGVVVAEQGGGAEEREQFQKGLDDALTESGVTIRLIDTDRAVSEGNTEGHARGIQVKFRFDAPDGPQLPAPDTGPIPAPNPNSLYRTYVGSATLGLASSAASLSNEGFSAGDLDDLGDLADGGTGTTSNVGSGGATTGSSGGGNFDSGGGGTSGSAPVPSASTGGQAEAPDVAPPSGQGGAVSAGGGPALLGAASAQELSELYLGAGVLTLLLFGLSRLPVRFLLDDPVLDN